MSFFFRFLLHRKVLKFWSNQTFGWECTCHTSLSNYWDTSHRYARRYFLHNQINGGGPTGQPIYLYSLVFALDLYHSERCRHAYLRHSLSHVHLLSLTVTVTRASTDSLMSVSARYLFTAYVYTISHSSTHTNPTTSNTTIASEIIDVCCA